MGYEYVVLLHQSAQADDIKQPLPPFLAAALLGPTIAAWRMVVYKIMLANKTASATQIMSLALTFY